eukprot:m.39194 g.39194  ORF g.39194 m.39194 type:complete len:87 (+) comp10274_c1_seq1:71-331(+)
MFKSWQKQRFGERGKLKERSQLQISEAVKTINMPRQTKQQHNGLERWALDCIVLNKFSCCYHDLIVCRIRGEKLVGPHSCTCDKVL